MVHAGLAPQWDLPLARHCAREFESALRRDPREACSTGCTAIEPDRWDDALRGDERLRFIVNCFTRLRYVDADGRLELRAKGSPKKAQTAVVDSLVRGARGALARTAHRVRSLVDVGILQRCRRRPASTPAASGEAA